MIQMTPAAFALLMAATVVVLTAEGLKRAARALYRRAHVERLRRKIMGENS